MSAESSTITVSSPIDPMIYVRAIHFAAAIMAAGVVFFVVMIAAPAFREAKDTAIRAALWPRLAAIAWFSLVLAIGSGVLWLVLTAASMSDQAPADVFAGGVLWTVLSQTTFGLDWLARLLLAILLAGALASLLSARKAALWIDAAAVILAAAFVGTLAWSGHAVGGQDSEAYIHPAADVLHLVAAAAWLGALIPLALLLAAAGKEGASIASARAATLRFSTLGLLSVGTLLITGAISTWYLAGSIAALTGTFYGQLLLAKIALFFVMVAIAAVNKQRLTPRLVQGESITTAQHALRQLRRNALIETLAGAVIICIVAMLGIEPPGLHADHHHAESGAIPADATFVHIHVEQGMADVMIEPGRVGRAHATIHLWNDDAEPLDAREVTLSIAPPGAGGRPSTRVAAKDPDGAWQVDGLELSQPGNWMATVEAVLPSNTHVVLRAPIVIDPAP
jgi:copper resistance protein D